MRHYAAFHEERLVLYHCWLRRQRNRRRRRFVYWTLFIYFFVV